MDETTAVALVNASGDVQLIEQGVVSIQYGDTWVNVSIYRCRVISEGGDTGLLVYIAGDPADAGIIPVVIYLPPGSIEVPPEGVDHVEPICNLTTFTDYGRISILGIPIDVVGVKQSENIYGHIGLKIYYQDGSTQDIQAYIPPTTYFVETQPIPPPVPPIVWYEVGKDRTIWLLGSPIYSPPTATVEYIWVDAGIIHDGLQMSSIKTTILVVPEIHTTITIEDIKETIMSIRDWDISATTPAPGEGEIVDIYYGDTLMWTI